MVYGLRYYFRLNGDNKRAINLPSLKKEAKLPVILNRSELRELFAVPSLLKHRIVLCLIFLHVARLSIVTAHSPLDTLYKDAL
jgi:hypothetical protein